jgi:hypothetical protein
MSFEIHNFREIKKYIKPTKTCRELKIKARMANLSGCVLLGRGCPDARYALLSVLLVFNVASLALGITQVIQTKKNANKSIMYLVCLALLLSLGVVLARFFGVSLDWATTVLIILFNAALYVGTTHQIVTVIFGPVRFTLARTCDFPR